MNSLDVFILLPLAVGFTFGLFRGLIRELASFLALVLGIYGAQYIAPQPTAFIGTFFELSPKIASVLSYLLSFAVLVSLLLLLARWVDKLLGLSVLGLANKLLGALFGALKVALLVSLLLNVANLFDWNFSVFSDENRKASFAYAPTLKLAPFLWNESFEYDAQEKRIKSKF